MTTISKKYIHNIIQDFSKEKQDSIFMLCENKQFSYYDLEDISNKIASSLISKGITNKRTIAIEVKEDSFFIISIIAIMKVGAKFLLLSPFNTIAVNEIILNYNNIGIVIANDSNNYSSKYEVVTISECLLQIENRVEIVENEIDDMLSLISEPTSMISVRNKYISFNKTINWINFNIHNLNIDFSCSIFIVSHQTLIDFPIWMASILTGGKIIISYKKEVEDILSIIIKHNVKSLICSLDDLHEITQKGLFKNDKFKSINNVLTLGDGEYNFNEFKIFNKDNGIKWYNYYGFPEVEIISTVIDDNFEQGKKIHIGKPVIGSDLLILSKSKQRCSINTKGELYTNKYGIISESNIKKEKIKDQFLFETDYKGFIDENGFLNLNLSLKEKINIDSYNLNLSFIEALLGACEIIKEFYLNIRNNSITIYFVQKDGFSAELLHAYLHTYLPIDINLIAFVELPFIPYSQDGTVDKYLLEYKQYVDTKLILNIEEEISSSIEEIREVCLMPKISCKKLENFHISDFDIINNHKIDVEKKEKANTIDPDENFQDAIVNGGNLNLNEETPTILPELLYSTCIKHGNQELVLIDAEGNRKSITYDYLFNRAKTIASGLMEKGLIQGDKVIILFDDFDDFFSVFWGSQLAGIISIPFSVPKLFDDNNETKTLLGIWNMLDKPYIVTTENIQNDLYQLNSEYHIIDIKVLNTYSPIKTWHKSNPDDIAIILFTSGSTGLPKGVTQSHKNIIYRALSTVDFYLLSDKEVSLNWFSVEHVGGLFMFHIVELYLGCKQIHIKSNHILSDISRWFDYISEYKATMTWAPNFAFKLATDNLAANDNRGWDLSSIKFCSNAGETVISESSKIFLKKLEKYQFLKNAMKPEWGMSETCSAVLASKSFSSDANVGIINIKRHTLGLVLEEATDTDNNAITFVSLGTPYKGLSIRIVDNNNSLLKERIIGRMQIKGNTITPGYYKNKSANDEVFVGDGWFDTGDLAFIYNGAVYFAGRTKDVIVINGINYNNIDIEATVEKLDKVDLSFTIVAAVKGIKNNDEKLAIFYCSNYTIFQDIIRQISEIKAYVTKEIGIVPDYIIPVLKQDIPKTSIGKLQRSKIVKNFEEGKFNSIIKQIDLYLNNNIIPSWFYILDWQRKNLSIIRDSSIEKNCIVFMDEVGLYPNLLIELKNRNYKKCVIVHGSQEFIINDRWNYSINFNNQNHYNELFGSLKDDCIDIHDIFYLRMYNNYSERNFELSLINDYVKDLFILQKLVKSLRYKNYQSVQLIIPANNINYILETDKIDYSKGWLSGFLKTLDLEEGLINPILLDIENANLEKNAKIIVNEAFVLNDSEVIYRNNLRYVPKLSQVDMNSIEKGQLPLINEAVYMVTGALGGIGMIISEWLLKEWKVKLVLVGRSNIFTDENANTKMQNYLKLKSISKDIVYLSGDISDEKFLSNCSTEVKNVWNRPIEGVFHLAGIGQIQKHLENIESHNINFETEEYYFSLFKSKVNGTIALNNLLKDNKDSLFVGFSSVLSIFGGASFSAYSSANSMLDTLCKYRRELGYRKTYCYNWSSWKDIGMSKDTTSSLTSRLGYDQIEKENGVNSLIIALSTDINGLVIGLNNSAPNISKLCYSSGTNNQNLTVYYEISKNETIEKEEIEKRIVDIVLKSINSSNYLLRQVSIDQIPMLKNGNIDRESLSKYEGKNLVVDNYIKPRNEVEIRLVSIWSNVFNIAEEKISINLNFFEIGGNSLIAINLSSKIYKEFNVKISIRNIFELPTISELAMIIFNLSENERVIEDIEI